MIARAADVYVTWYTSSNLYRVGRQVALRIGGLSRLGKLAGFNRVI